MASGRVKKYSIVIMDASDLSKVGKIFLYVDEILRNRCSGRKAQWHTLDENHPTAIVLDTEVDWFTGHILQTNIDEMYPGLCVFNPHI